MEKKLTKIMWYGAETDANGNPVVPSISPSVERHLEGLNEGEIYIHNDDTNPAIFIRTNRGNIVAIGGGDIETLKKMFLRKDQDDRSKGSLGVDKDFDVLGNAEVGGNQTVKGNATINGTATIGSDATIGGQTTMEKKATAKKGMQFGESFASGILTGHGGHVDEYGNGELESLIIRRFLEVPELRFNRVQVTLGDKWNAAGAGVLERVVPDEGAMTGTAWLKLEDGEYGAIAVGDICMGIFHSEDSSIPNATEDADDSRGNFQFAGFYTCYFTITEITGSDNKEFRYQMRPESDRWKLTYHPSAQMTFVSYGSFSQTDRQTSVYTTRTYTRLLKNQNTWEISAANIAMQYGNMENMSIHGLDMTGYSMYLNNIYMTGKIREVRPDGTPVMVVNDRGEWVSGTTYAYYDRVSYNGSLWLCVNESGTNTTPSKSDASWLLQVEAGVGITSSGQWKTANTPYKANTVVTFADSVWISNKETSEAPFPIYTDNQGNRLTFNDGGYILVSPLIQSADWDLLLSAPDLTKGEDGKSIEARYSADKTNWHSSFQDGDLYMQQRVGDGAWSNAMRIVGESGADGTDGVYAEFQFAKNTSLTTAPTTGWQDGPPSTGKGEFLWMRQRVVDPNANTATSWRTVRVKGDTGEKGDSITNMGNWETGMAVPALGVVVMGGKTYMAKVATTNPPLWCYTDNEGNRLLFSDGGYILTGEENSDEYTLMVESGKDGRDGKDYEYIYIHTTENIRPSTPVGTQTDDYVPSGWHDNPIGVSEELPFEWVSLRTKKDGMWSEFSTPAIWTKWGFDGENAILADIDNEMDNVALDSEGKTTSSTEIDITASMFYGSSKQALTAISVSSVANITSSYVLNTGVITLKIAKGVSIAERNEISITLKSNINGKEEERAVKFTLAGVRAGADGQSAVLYDIVLSASSIVLKKDGSYSVETISATRNKTVGSLTTETTDGVLKYSIDGGSETIIANNTPIPVENIKTNIKFMLYDSNGTLLDKETVPFIMDGADGDGFTMMGNYKTGMAVPKMGVVTMGGSVYVAKVATTNPPLWTYTDNSGNRLLYNDGGYILTGEVNTTEYELWVEKPLDGKDGKDGINGTNGKDGKDGEQGIQGCIVRDSEWAVGVEYRNDEALTSGTRWLDVALISDPTSPTGWIAYKCKQTHTSTKANAPGNTNFWEELTATFAAIFTSLIIAKNAKITFLQGNQLLIQEDDGTVTAGMSGSNEGSAYRFWAGAETPDDAPFRVDKYGNAWMTKAHVTGEVNATSGKFEGEITAGSLAFKAIVANGSSVSMNGYTFAKGHGIYTLPSPKGFTQVYAFCDWYIRTARDFTMKAPSPNKIVIRNAQYVSGFEYVDEYMMSDRTLYKFTCMPNDTYEYVWVVTKEDMI